jgi:hypothetical protein
MLEAMKSSIAEKALKGPWKIFLVIRPMLNQIHCWWDPTDGRTLALGTARSHLLLLADSCLMSTVDCKT